MNMNMCVCDYKREHYLLNDVCNVSSVLENVIILALFASIRRQFCGRELKLAIAHKTLNSTKLKSKSDLYTNSIFIFSRNVRFFHD